MDIPLVIRHRLEELGLEQKDLAAAAQVTESYISQLLARKKVPPAPSRTDIYEKIGSFLKLPAEELSKLAELQRQDSLKKKVSQPLTPLFGECRELILQKCESGRQEEIRSIFEKAPFGELERLVTQKLLEVAKEVTKQELENEKWLRLMVQLSGRNYEQMRVGVARFLETDVFHISVESSVPILESLIESWDIDLKTFGMEIALNHKLAPARPRRFEFVEKEPEQAFCLEPGLEEFLKDKALSSDATDEEIEFLRRLRFRGKQPTPIYYYRELQSLRDPLHFYTPGVASER